jgi:hypothetical protein
MDDVCEYQGLTVLFVAWTIARGDEYYTDLADERAVCRVWLTEDGELFRETAPWETGLRGVRIPVVHGNRLYFNQADADAAFERTEEQS